MPPNLKLTNLFLGLIRQIQCSPKFLAIQYAALQLWYEVSIYVNVLQSILSRHCVCMLTR